jgi:hypothetical protein
MKYKVLLLLVFATLAYSKFLGRSKIRHPPTFTLDFKYTEDELKDYYEFYVFCTDDEFASFNELFETKILINDISSGWSEEIKTEVGSLIICLYNLQNSVKSEIPCLSLPLLTTQPMELGKFIPDSKLTLLIIVLMI